MNKWKAFVKIKQEPPKPPPPEEPKILTGIVYSHPHLKNIFYTEDDLIYKTNYQHIESDLDIREELPPSPYSIYKDEHRNDQLNAYYMKMKSSGILDAMKQEQSYRVAKIRLTKSFECYPLSFATEATGMLYHDSYLDIFPSFVCEAWKPQISHGYKLTFLKKLPFMLHKDNFIIEKEKETPQYDLFS